jgi:hypothetical protein
MQRSELLRVFEDSDETLVGEAMRWCRRSGKWAPGTHKNFQEFVRMLQVCSCASGPASAPCDTDWPPDEVRTLNPSRRAAALISCFCAAQEVAVDPRDLDVGKEIGIAASLPPCLAAAFLLAAHCLHTVEVAAFSTRV